MIMAKLYYYLDKRRPAPNGECYLRLAVNLGGKTAYAQTGVMLRPEFWNEKKQCVVMASDKDSVNDFLLGRMVQYRGALRDIMVNNELKARVTAQELRNMIIDRIMPNEPEVKTFKNVFDEFVGTHENQRTRALYNATWKQIESFVGEKAVGKLTFDDINRAWLDRFFAWMTDKSPSVNARNIHLRNIRSVFNFAIDDEVTTCYPFRRVKIRPVETAKRNLTPMQLRMIFNAPVEEWAQKYIDMFKLSFLLIGINIGDMLTLSSDCIHNGRIEYNRKKTHRFYSVKVLPEAMEIIRKYTGTERLLYLNEHNKSYRVTANRINKALQRVMPGVTTYYARHSWATIAASLDIPKETIAHALGHAQNTVTDVYIQFDRRKVDAANRRVIDYVLYGKQ